MGGNVWLGGGWVIWAMGGGFGGCLMGPEGFIIPFYLLSWIFKEISTKKPLKF